MKAYKSQLEQLVGCIMRLDPDKMGDRIHLCELACFKMMGIHVPENVTILAAPSYTNFKISDIRITYHNQSGDIETYYMGFKCVKRFAGAYDISITKMIYSRGEKNIENTGEEMEFGEFGMYVSQLLTGSYFGNSVSLAIRGRFQEKGIPVVASISDTSIVVNIFDALDRFCIGDIYNGCFFYRVSEMPIVILYNEESKCKTIPVTFDIVLESRGDWMECEIRVLNPERNYEYGCIRYHEGLNNVNAGDIRLNIWDSLTHLNIDTSGETVEQARNATYISKRNFRSFTEYAFGCLMGKTYTDDFKAECLGTAVSKRDVNRFFDEFIVPNSHGESDLRIKYRPFGEWKELECYMINSEHKGGVRKGCAIRRPGIPRFHPTEVDPANNSFIVFIPEEDGLEHIAVFGSGKFGVGHNYLIPGEDDIVYELVLSWRNERENPNAKHPDIVVESDEE